MIDIQSKIEEYEHRIQVIQSLDAAESIAAIELMEEFARFLKANKVRLLDAANWEAKAKVMRGKLSTRNHSLQNVESPDTERSSEDTRICPFCAETIKIDAVICRFCRINLRSRNKLISIICICLAIIATLAYWIYVSTPKIDVHAYRKDMAPAILPKAKITGASWVVKEGGQSDIQRGMEIVLCNTGVVVEIGNALRSAKEELARDSIRSPYLILDKAFSLIGQSISKDIVQITQTDVDGKYVMTDIKPGSYLIYARYQTNFSACYWLIPVKITGAEELKINLDNSNMMECVNKNDY